MKIFYCLLASLLIAASPVISQNVVQLGTLRDNTLFEDAGGTLSNGAGPNFFVGRNNLAQLRRGVIAFDVAGSVPAGAVIDSVRLTLFMSQSTSGPSDVALHPLTQDWGEGTSISGGGMGAPATTNDATWIHTFYNTAFWGTTGGDFSATMSASQSVSGVGSYEWGSTSQMISDVQTWLDSPSSNFGWILIGNEAINQTAKRFETKENTVVANRPVLAVYWSPTVSVDDGHPVAPSRFTLDVNYPNPFNPSTTIGYTLPEGSHVSLVIYNLVGQQIATLVDRIEAPGYKDVRWDGLNDKGIAVPSGIYVYRVIAGKNVQTRSMILSK